MSAGALVLLSLWVALLHGGVLGPHPPPPRPAATTPGAGRAYLKVVVDPWAHVYVDGTFFDTTPFAREIPLTAGKHEIRLTNDYFQEKTVVLDLAAGAHETLRTKLTRR